ncbi:unnamed protein product [Calypogeia fissa]
MDEDDQNGAADDGAGGDTLSFSLLLDKSLPSLVEIAAWNPGKDLLAMVTKDHQLVVHRLNWQRLWAVTPDLKVTAICWRPDGKALAVGHNNGSIAIHDVENGDVVRKTQTHQVAVQCLYWAEESQTVVGSEDNVFIYEDRTHRFFPPPPKAPPMPGTAPSFDMSNVLGSNMEDLEGNSLKGTTRDVKHRLDILCSGDRDGLICLSAFGVFPIGKLGMRDLTIRELGTVDSSSCQLLDAYALQVSLSNDLRRMTVVCSGSSTSEVGHAIEGTRDPGIYCISVNTALLGNRRKELRQVALQASSVEELVDVLQTSLAVMEKHWSEAIDSFKEKINGFSKLISEHGSNATPKDEFLGLLTWGYASPALQQFLAVSLGEAGLKRLSKSIDTAARELHNIIAEHMQATAEIITFRLGELRGLSRWKARLGCVGLEEALLDGALEHAGMLLVQLERLLHIISDTTGGFRPFFVWLVKVLRQVNRESLPHSEQLPNVDSMAVATFLQQDFEKDQIGGHLSNSMDVSLDVSLELVEMMEEVAIMGGYKDINFLQRTLAQEVHLLAQSCQEAFTMPLKVVSPQLGSPHMIPLGEMGFSPSRPMSLTYFEVKQDNDTVLETEDRLPLVEYVCFHNSGIENQSVVGILRGFGSNNGASGGNKGSLAEAISLYLDESLRCIDLALYKKRQLLLLVTDGSHDPDEGSGQAWLMLLQLDDLVFHELTPSTFTHRNTLHLRSSSEAGADIGLTDGKVRELPQADVVIPLAVSASRGLACVFTSQRRMLLFDLEEDEEGKGEDVE